MFMSLSNRILSRNKLKSDKSLYSKNERKLEIRDSLVSGSFCFVKKTFVNETYERMPVPKQRVV